MNNFITQSTPFIDFHILKRKIFRDDRGFFAKLYSENDLKPFLANKHIVQINLSRTTQKGTIRGMHFQKHPFADLKIVQCTKGKIIDIVVDLRKASPDFLKWHAEELSDTNGKSLIIPEGFAHGFQTLCDDCEILYFHTAPYKPDYEGGINPLDPKLNIKWPLEVSQLSSRDSSFPPITSEFSGVFK